jgi:GNAT superfamily N-acetyltransferase
MLHVRPARSADLEFIVAANVRLAEESEHLLLDEPTLREGVLSILNGLAPGRYWLAEQEDRIVGQLSITFEWSDWRNRMVWWIQSVYVIPDARQRGVFRALHAHVRREAQAAGAGGLRLYVDTTNTRAQAVYAAVGMDGAHYRVFEQMFSTV